MSTSLRVGMVCHSGFGGSGVIATELGLRLAERGHAVHFLSASAPPRLSPGPRAIFHAVRSPTHPLFPAGEYALALASKLVEVATAEALDVVHVHYALPHATSAQLARQILGPAAPKLVVTLHGTDVLTFGDEPAFAPVLRHSVAASDAITVPSAFLQSEAVRLLGLAPASVEVVPNFVDTERFRPAAVKDPARLAALFPHLDRGGRAPRVLLHNSNFRSLKRVEDVVRILARVRERVPAVLVLVGDGPEAATVERLITQLKLTDAVHLTGTQQDVTWLLQGSDVFLLPSGTESFGLAALEALACGVPVVASNVGGLPEVISDGVNGFLHPAGDVAAMAASVCRLLEAPAELARFGSEARRLAELKFRRDPMVERYEAVYRRVCAR